MFHISLRILWMRSKEFPAKLDVVYLIKCIASNSCRAYSMVKNFKCIRLSNFSDVRNDIQIEGYLFVDVDVIKSASNFNLESLLWLKVIWHLTLSSFNTTLMNIDGKTWWILRRREAAWETYCMEYADGGCRRLLACFSFWRYISRFASWIASYILASLIICLMRFSIAGSEFNSKSSETLVSSSSKVWGGGGATISFDLFLPQPVKALQNGRFALVSIWLPLNCARGSFRKISWESVVWEWNRITNLLVLSELRNLQFRL